MSDTGRDRMRLLAAALLAANVLFFIYARVGFGDRAAAARIDELQMNHERIRVLRAVTHGARADAQPQDAPVTKRSACLEWGPFAGPALTRAAASMSGMNLVEVPVQGAPSDSAASWVVIPGSLSRADAEREARALDPHGVTDYFIVQEAQGRHTIVLGVFAAEAAASAYASGLVQKGLRSVVAQRNTTLATPQAYYVRDPDQAAVARMTELQREFTGTTIKASACP
jgi:hypothetical protein